MKECSILNRNYFANKNMNDVERIELQERILVHKLQKKKEIRNQVRQAVKMKLALEDKKRELYLEERSIMNRKQEKK